jgi:adenylate kinase family enzyme
MNHSDMMNRENPVLWRIHIMGAPGAGVSTFGRQLAAKLGYVHLDTDDFYWFTQDELPYKRKRNPDHRRRELAAALDQAERWVLSGSLCGWGDVFIPRFQKVYYLTAPADLRAARIRARETARYGPERIAPGGDLHIVFEKFLDWAARYDEPSDNPRSGDQELRWLEQLQCPVEKIIHTFEP